MRYKIFALVIACLSLFSCDLLEEHPSTSLTDSQVYNTEEGLESAVYGIYSKLYGGSGPMGQQNEFLGSTSLLIHWRNNRTSDRWASALKMTLYSTSSDNSGFFLKYYSVIAACNRLLDKLGDSPVDDGFKKEIEGEARFVRAVMYFYLVRLYGDVPLVLHCSSDLETVQAARDKYTLVYAQIVEDLIFARDAMRSKERQTQATGTSGRVCNEAAVAYLAAVYNQIGSILSDVEYQFFDNSNPDRHPDFSAVGVSCEADAWRKSAGYATEVIDSGVYSLATDYAALFRWESPEDYNLGERIFVLQSTATISESNLAAQYSLPSCPLGSMEYTVVNNNDGRYRPDRIVYQKWCRVHGGQLETARKDSLQNIWSGCRDPRLDVSYFHGSYYNQCEEKEIDLYPTYGTLTNIKTGEINNQNTAGFPYFKKYLDPRYDGTTANSDVYLMRFAEVYLLRAEAYASLSAGPGDDDWNCALDDIETLHARARGELDPAAVQSDFPVWRDGQFATKDELIEGIMWERVFELHGEGGEFYETHRRGSRFMSSFIAKPMSEFLLQTEQSGAFFKYFYLGTLPETDPQLLRRSVLLAYPQDELSRNGKAVQNDFYWY